MRQIIFLLTLLMACVMPQNADAQDEHYISLRSMGESYDFRVNSVDSIVFMNSADSMAVNLPLLYRLVKENRERIGELTSLVGSETSEYIARPAGHVNNWIYGKDKYVGYNKPARENVILDRVEAKVYGFTPDDIGEGYDFAIGIIDQRNWLLPRVIVTGVVSAVNDGVVTFDFAEGTAINAGECIFFKTEPKSMNASLCLSSENVDESCPLYVFDSLEKSGQRKDYDLACYRVHVKSTGNIYALKSEVDNLSERIAALDRKLSQLGYVSDKVTGEKYRLEMADGQIITVPTTVKSMLVIGHSYVNYENTPAVGWYLDDGENRAMAASVNSHQWTSFVGDRLGATVARRNSVDFERNYSPSYDFAGKWDVSDKYDAICVFMGENVAQVTPDFATSVRAAMKYLKSSAPHATIYWSSSWSYGDKYKVMRDAALQEGVTFVDVTDTWSAQEGKATFWQKGDYYQGRGGAYYPVGVASAHPNDMGHLGIANKYLLAMGYDEISDVVHQIELREAKGGTLSTPNTSWPEGGIVTIRTSADEGYVVSSVSVTAGGKAIKTVKRTNDSTDGTPQTYYTFVMPKSDVVVTPVWKRVE